jgi:hypothetical protein
MRPTFDHGIFGGRHNDLFRPGPNISLNACVGRNGGRATFERYSWGYFDAAARLTESIYADSFGVDGLIYPLVLLYRHGIETALKHLARRLSVLNARPSMMKKTHRLLDNWSLVRGDLAKLGAERQELDKAEKLLKQFVEFDANGEVFRYPEAQDESPHLDETSLINVQVFAEQMAWLASFLGGSCSWVEHHIDLQCEQRSYESGYGNEW